MNFILARNIEQFVTLLREYKQLRLNEAKGNKVHKKSFIGRYNVTQKIVATDELIAYVNGDQQTAVKNGKLINIDYIHKHTNTIRDGRLGDIVRKFAKENRFKNVRQMLSNQDPFVQCNVFVRKSILKSNNVSDVHYNPNLVVSNIIDFKDENLQEKFYSIVLDNEVEKNNSLTDRMQNYNSNSSNESFYTIINNESQFFNRQRSIRISSSLSVDNNKSLTKFINNHLSNVNTKTLVLTNSNVELEYQMKNSDIDSWRQSSNNKIINSFADNSLSYYEDKFIEAAKNKNLNIKNIKNIIASIKKNKNTDNKGVLKLLNISRDIDINNRNFSLDPFYDFLTWAKSNKYKTISMANKLGFSNAKYLVMDVYSYPDGGWDEDMLRTGFLWTRKLIEG